MKDERKHPDTIRKQVRQLRKLIESQDTDLITRRIAQGMEESLRWASIRVVGWSPLENAAKELALFLKEDLTKSK